MKVLIQNKRKRLLKDNKQLKSKHLSGPDNISNLVLKTGAKPITFFISEAITISFESEVYLEKLENAKVIPFKSPSAARIWLTTDLFLL